MQFTLFHLTNSRSQRIVWLFEELGFDYELKIYQQHITKHEDAEIKQFNLNAKFPTLIITDQQHQKSTVLTETSAIAEYCSHLSGQLGLEQFNADEIMDYYFWKNFADSNLMPNVALKQIFKQLVRHTPFPIRFITRLIKHGFDQGFLNKSLDQQLQLINSQLEHCPFIAGSKLSIADILLWFPLKASTALNPKFQSYTAIQNYLSQIENRPAFKTALVKGQWSAETFQDYWSSAY